MILRRCYSGSDDAGVIDVEWDPATGEPSRIVKISAEAGSRGGATVDLTVGRPQEAQAKGASSLKTEVIRRGDREAKTSAEEGEDR